MKSVHYVATVASVYRKAIDAYMKDQDGYKVLTEWIEELNKVSHRPYTEALPLHARRRCAGYTTSSYEQTHDFVGIVLSYDKANKKALIEQRNNVKNGEKLELLMTDGTLMPLELKKYAGRKKARPSNVRRTHASTFGLTALRSFCQIAAAEENYNELTTEVLSICAWRRNALPT